MSLLKRLIASVARRPNADLPYDDLRISHDREGLKLRSLSSGPVVWSFAWSDVRRATAHKRDLISTDLVCLEFDLATQSFEVNEEMAGWQSLVDLLGQYLEGAQSYSKWWPEVVQPAFHPCRVLVFERPVV